MCDLCRGLTDGCPNCDNQRTFDDENDENGFGSDEYFDKLDQLLDRADFLNDLQREREREDE